MASHDYDEKRSFVRMQVKTSLRFSVQGSNTTQHQGVSHDLSATGLLMGSDFSPEEGDKITVTIATDNERFEPFTAQGSVIRVEPNDSENQRYLISVEFDTDE